jgi:hypothetical protein
VSVSVKSGAVRTASEDSERDVSIIAVTRPTTARLATAPIMMRSRRRRPAARAARWARARGWSGAALVACCLGGLVRLVFSSNDSVVVVFVARFRAGAVAAGLFADLPAGRAVRSMTVTEGGDDEHSSEAEDDESEHRLA